jgi:hypothetical protein
VLVVGLVLGSSLAAFIAGPVRPAWIALLALVAGLPVPVAELVAGGSPVAFAATALAAVGATIGWAAARAVAPQGT